MKILQQNRGLHPQGRDSLAIIFRSLFQIVDAFDDVPQFLGKNFVFDERMGERISEEILSVCHQCGNPCDTHLNCANDACHILFIQCEECAKEYENCCSTKCRDFNRLDPDQQEILKKKILFNGTKFGKGRYKAMKKDEALEWIHE